MAIFIKPAVDDVNHGLPPENALRSVFTEEVLGAWRKVARPSDWLHFRLRVLGASDPAPSDPLLIGELRSLRAWKAAWETYLYAAFACEMFKGKKEQDLRARLTGVDDEGFRSAMDECLACWLFAGRLKIPVNPDAPGRKGKNLEMKLLLPDGDVGVEVKSPYRETPKPPPGKHSVVWWGDDSDKITQCLESANTQFRDDQRNLLVIVPRLRVLDRRTLMRAVYGVSKITALVNTQTGQAGPTKTKFFPEGKFLNPNLPNGSLIKQDGFPTCRRISAIICIEEMVKETLPSTENGAWIDHRVVVLHNPVAYHPLPQETLKAFPQFLPAGDTMSWTDGHDPRV